MNTYHSGCEKLKIFLIIKETRNTDIMSKGWEYSYGLIYTKKIA